MGRDRAGNGRVESGAVYMATTKFADARSVCVSCSYCLAIYTYCLKLYAMNIVSIPHMCYVVWLARPSHLMTGVGRSSNPDYAYVCSLSRVIDLMPPHLVRL